VKAKTTYRTFHSFLKNGPSFSVLAQSWESHAADKLAAMITLGIDNTRLKDFLDLYRLSRRDLDVREIAVELSQTLKARGVDAMESHTPAGLSEAFIQRNQAKWGAGVLLLPDDVPFDLAEVVDGISAWYGTVQKEIAALEADEKATTMNNDNVVYITDFRRAS
jgi:hypothetical protein